jgi:hypothetical protein
MATQATQAAKAAKASQALQEPQASQAKGKAQAPDQVLNGKQAKGQNDNKCFTVKGEFNQKEGTATNLEITGCVNNTKNANDKYFDITVNNKYFKRLLTQPPWEKIKTLNIKDKKDIITLLEKFATFQDTIYGGEYKEKSTLLDDFLEIAYLFKYHSELKKLLTKEEVKEKLKELVTNIAKAAEDANKLVEDNKDYFVKLFKDNKTMLSDTHDAWAYARFVQFKNDLSGVDSFTESISKTSANKYALYPVILNIEKEIQPVVQLRRIPQLVEFNDLIEDEALKDVVPLISYLNIISDEGDTETIKTIKTIHDMIFLIKTGGKSKSKSIPYEKRTIEQLKALAKSRKIKCTSSMKKSDIIKLIRKS